MIVPFILYLILLWNGREDLDANWIWGTLGVLAVCLLLILLFHGSGYLFVVPVVLVDIALLLKVYGGDVTIR